MSNSNRSSAYDLVIVGGTAGGLSVAVSSLRSGLAGIRIIEAHHQVSFPDLAVENDLDIGLGEFVTSIDTDGDHLIITTNRLAYRTTACLIANRTPLTDWKSPSIAVDSQHVSIDTLPDDLGPDTDVLVVGYTDHAVEHTVTFAAQGHRVVLAAGGMDPTRLSPAGEHVLRQLERDRRVTLLYRAVPRQISDVDGFPMAFFGDRRTPDLQFDHIVLASLRETLTPGDVSASEAAVSTGRLWFLGEPFDDERDLAPTAPGWRVGEAIADACFPHLELPRSTPSIQRRLRHSGAIDELRDEFYNATITHFEPTHSDLWVMRVSPDHGEAHHVPGQYASLGLGYWEPRIDDATDPDLDDKWDKLIRRSYSISSRIFDDHGYLSDDSSHNELEFYIVLVRPSDSNVPGLTPRLALKRPGDRIYLGPKVTGRYTLAPVDDPTTAVVFLGTGTGEAPHNSMVVELLRKGHHGPIVSVVSVRQWNDLGYLKEHRELEQRYANYHHLPLPTREPDVAKRYIQQVIEDNVLSADYGIDLHPDHTHVFMCGNPAMIGLPDDGEYPKTTGAVELLVKQGFTLSQHKAPGNLHYEEYW